MKERDSWNVFYKAILTIAIPIAFQNLLGTTASMVDTVMIGSQGELAVAAVGICSQLTSFFGASYAGFISAAVLFFAQFWGARNEKGINKTLGFSMILMLLIGLIFGGAAVTNPGFLLRIYTDKENIVNVAIPYLRIVGFVYPIMVVSAILSVLLRSTERVKASLIASVAGMCTNLILNWLLIYGRFGLPKMGVAGAAVGTLASGIVNLLLLLFFLLRDKRTVVLKWTDMFAIDGEFVANYMKKGIALLCHEVLYGLGQVLINMVIGRQDESAIAAMAAFRVLEGFVFAFYGGLAEASSVLVGKEVGAGHLKMAKKYLKGFSVLCPVVTFAICLLGILFHKPILAMFGLGTTAMNYGKYMLYVFLAAGTIRTCTFIMNLCFRAGGETVFGAILEVAGLFLLNVPATWIAGMVLKLPFPVVFAFVYADEIVRLFFEIWYARSGKWIKPVTEAGIKALAELREHGNVKQE